MLIKHVHWKDRYAQRIKDMHPELLGSLSKTEIYNICRHSFKSYEGTFDLPNKPRLMLSYFGSFRLGHRTCGKFIDNYMSKLIEGVISIEEYKTNVNWMLGNIKKMVVKGKYKPLRFERIINKSKKALKKRKDDEQKRITRDV